MRVPKRVDADAGNEVEVPIPLEIIDMATLATVKDNRITAVVLEKILTFYVNNRIRRRGGRGVRNATHFLIIHAADDRPRVGEAAGISLPPSR
jgi:hypothetical protein